jgi:abhydrolase domain-containing protein 13
MCAFVGILYNAQDLLLYYPDQPSSSRLFVDSPSAYGLFHESVYIRSLDGTQLHAQFVRQPSSVSAAAPTVVFFHGNAGNIGHRLPNVQAMCLHNHVNVLLVEYRGYGKSRGCPSEQGNLCIDNQSQTCHILTYQHFVRSFQIEGRRTIQSLSVVDYNSNLILTRVMYSSYPLHRYLLHCVT